MSDQRLPPFVSPPKAVSPFAPPTDAAVLEEQARNPGTPSGYYFGDKPDHRYWQTVILREDQVDLIARRVVELLHEQPAKRGPSDTGPKVPVGNFRPQTDSDDAPGINSFVEHNRLGLGTKQVRTQLYRPDDPPPVPEEQRMLAVEVTPLEEEPYRAGPWDGWNESD